MQNFDNSDYAANFTAAYEAGSEETQRAPFRMPISISRRRPRRRSAPVAKIGFFEGDDRREASRIARAQVFFEECYGTPTSPEDALNDMIDGKLDEESHAILRGYDEPIEYEREYFVDGLTEDEQALVRRFGEEDPEQLHPTEERTINPPPQHIIDFWRRVYDVDNRKEFDKLVFELKALREAEYESNTYRITVSVKPELEVIDREDETEAHQASDEYRQSMTNARKRRFRQYVNIRRRARKGGKIKCVRNRGQKHRRYNIDRSTPRYERWEEQLPFYSLEAWIEDNMQEAFEEEMSTRECDEDMEAEAADSTEEQFQQYLNKAERAFRVYALNYAIDCRLMNNRPEKVAA